MKKSTLNQLLLVIALVAMALPMIGCGDEDPGKPTAPAPGAGTAGTPGPAGGKGGIAPPGV